VIGAQRVVLRLGAQPERAAGPVGLLPESERSRRFGGLQQRLRDAFCDDPLLAPGRYAATLRFRITAEGHVDDAELLVGSGDARRDRRLLLAIGRLAPSIDAASTVPHTMSSGRSPHRTTTVATAASSEGSTAPGTPRSGHSAQVSRTKAPNPTTSTASAVTASHSGAPENEATIRHPSHDAPKTTLARARARPLRGVRSVK
jgi:hypothetical protein